MGHFFAFFSICFAFFAHLKSASLFLSIFIDFLLILEGFGVDLERILGCFSIIFLIFLENADFVKYSVFPWKNHVFHTLGS